MVVLYTVAIASVQVPLTTSTGTRVLRDLAFSQRF